jgi:hypothetical protein
MTHGQGPGLTTPSPQRRMNRWSQISQDRADCPSGVAANMART